MQSRLIQPLRVIANIHPYIQSENLIYISCMDGVFYKEFLCTTCFVIVFYRCLYNWYKSYRSKIIVIFQDMFIIKKYYDWLLIEIFNFYRFNGKLYTPDQVLTVKVTISGCRWYNTHTHTNTDTAPPVYPLFPNLSPRFGKFDGNKCHNKFK